MIDISKLDNVLTEEKFVNYRDAFLKKVTDSPFMFNLIVISVTSSDANSIEAFTGSQGRTALTYTLPCLYEYTMDEDGRESVGLTSSEFASIFISPTQLEEVVGTYKLDKSKIKFSLNGDEYITTKVTYLLEVYNSCVSVQISGKLSTRG